MWLVSYYSQIGDVISLPSDNIFIIFFITLAQVEVPVCYYTLLSARMFPIKLIQTSLFRPSNASALFRPLPI